MLHRRSFLGLGGAAAAAFAVGCRPPPPSARAQSPERSHPSPSPARPSAAILQDLAGLPDRRQLMLGYPINMALPRPGFVAWQRELATVGLDQFAFNNVGDPWQPSHIPFNSHALERELIARFADRYGFAADDRWGFLSHSGTDSNMHGLYMGRTLLKGRTGRAPRLYFTTEAHYSIQILGDLLALDLVRVGTHGDGRMDEHDLAAKLAAHPDEPALVCATLGTTFKGAVDSIDAIQAQLDGREAYLHVDAALFGGYLPHTEHAAEIAQRRDGVARYDSLAVSCHKFFGFAAPAGLFISTKAAFEGFHALFSQVHDPEYIHQVPGTITCSREAVKPAEFYYHATEEAVADQRRDAAQILADAAWLHAELATKLPELDPVLASPMSNTVYFRKPSEAVISTYSLATMGEHAHVVVMPHATREILDRFVADLRAHPS